MCTLEIAYLLIIIYFWCPDAYHIRLAEKNMVTHVEVSPLITPVEKIQFLPVLNKCKRDNKEHSAFGINGETRKFKVKKYHLDNRIFATTAFKTHCESQQQEISFRGVGAHHQNGVAERNIKTVAQWARANMLHLALHWPAQANISFWPQAIEYSVWVFNRMPNAETGISPNKIWSSV
jgi:hypothetical protein